MSLFKFPDLPLNVKFQHGLNVEALLATMHGMRAIETMQRVGLPGLDLEEELRAVERAELEDVEGIEAITGIASFLESLPPDRWAIATSASRSLATRRLAAAGLPAPPLLIGSDDVAVGKPPPDGFSRYRGPASRSSTV